MSSALYYQLNERISFVKPKEAIVAQLLFDLDNLAFLRNDFSLALADYQDAQKYGYSGKLIADRIKESTRLNKLSKEISYIEVHRPALPNYFMIGLWALGAFMLISIFVYIYKQSLNS